jgi:quinol monooxygenase YgiN
MLVLQVNLRIKPENVDAFMKKAIENATAARKEPGCRHFDVLVDPGDRTKAMLYEVYDDEAAFDAHLQTPHLKTFRDGIEPLVVSRNVRRLTRAHG